MSAADGVFAGTVVSLHLAGAAGQATRSVGSVEAVPRRGLEGDRYYLGTGFYSNRPAPDRELTLIGIEALEDLRRTYGIVLRPGDARRNVVTRSVPLNDLVGREFRVGEVLARGMRLCEPCVHLDEVTGLEVLRPLVHRGGLRARILTAGTIRVGDPVHPARDR